MTGLSKGSYWLSAINQGVCLVSFVLRGSLP